MTQIAATDVLHTRIFINKEFTEAEWDRILGEMSPETQGLFNKFLKAGDWVDYEQVVDMLRAVKEILSPRHEDSK